jgi:hypothetical protein
MFDIIVRFCCRPLHSGRGLKLSRLWLCISAHVALFTEGVIEIALPELIKEKWKSPSSQRAWIECEWIAVQMEKLQTSPSSQRRGLIFVSGAPEITINRHLHRGRIENT